MSLKIEKKDHVATRAGLLCSRCTRTGCCRPENGLQVAGWFDGLAHRPRKVDAGVYGDFTQIFDFADFLTCQVHLSENHRALG